MRTRQHETTEMLEQKKPTVRFRWARQKIEHQVPTTLPKIKFQVSLYAGTIIESEA